MEKIGEEGQNVLVSMHPIHWELLVKMKRGEYKGGSICLCGNLIKKNKGRICENCTEDYH